MAGTRTESGSGIEARRKAALEDGSASYLARRDEIIRAAAHVFKDRGSGATLRDVAEVLETDRASLYYYVGSKEELLQEIVKGALDQSLKAAETVKRSRRTTPEKIRALIESMVFSYAENYPHMHVYIEDLGRIARSEDPWAGVVVEQTKEYEAIVRSILTKGRNEGTLRADVPVHLALMALFGMINWMHRWYRPGSANTPAEIAHSMTEIFLGGYAAR